MGRFKTLHQGAEIERNVFSANLNTAPGAFHPALSDSLKGKWLVYALWTWAFSLTLLWPVGLYAPQWHLNLQSKCALRKPNGINLCLCVCVCVGQLGEWKAVYSNGRRLWRETKAKGHTASTALDLSWPGQNDSEGRASRNHTTHSSLTVARVMWQDRTLLSFIYFTCQITYRLKALIIMVIHIARL